MTKTDNKKLGLTIICVSLFQMGMVALSPVISSISRAFPGTSEFTAQMSTTFLNFILVLTALLSGKISRRIGRRNMMITGMCLLVLVGFCGCLFSVGLWAVYLWSALLGVGTGLFVPAALSMIVDYFTEPMRSTLAGRQTAACNLGGVLLSLLSGIFAAMAWNNAYLVFLFAIPILVMCFVFLPREQGEIRADNTATKTRGKIHPTVWTTTLKAIIFGVVYFTFSTNVSLLLAERGYTETSLAGTATACFMLGGVVCGYLFSKIYSFLKDNSEIGAFILISLSYLCIRFVDTLPAMLIASFVGGGSLSLIFPSFLIKTADHVTPESSVMSTSLMLSVGPNLGSFLSPVIVTNLSAIINQSVQNRFLIASLLGFLSAAVLLIINTRGAHYE